MTSFSSARTADNVVTNDPYEARAGFVFFLFCLWAFVVLCRPQDIFPELGQFRPALAMGTLTFGFVALRYKNLPGPPLFQERQLRYFAALVFILVLSIPFSLYPRFSFELIFTGYINVIFFVFIFYKLVHSVKRLNMILLLSCIGSGIYAAYALAAYSPETGRLAYGGVFDPNDIAFFALGFMPLNLIFISRDNLLWIRLACICFFCMNVLLILQTGSRGGFLAFAAVMALLLFRRTNTVRFALKAAFFAMFIIIFSVSSIDTERYRTILNIEDDYNIHAEGGRLDLWQIGAKSLLKNPLTGVGAGAYPIAVGLDREAQGSETRRWQAAHNSVIQIGAETGVVGLFLFLLISVNVFVILRRVKKKIPGNLTKISEMSYIGFTGICISGMFLSQAYSFYWAFFVAISAVVHQLDIKEDMLESQKQVR